MAILPPFTGPISGCTGGTGGVGGEGGPGSGANPGGTMTCEISPITAGSPGAAGIMLDMTNTSSIIIVDNLGNQSFYDMDLLDPGVYDEVAVNGITIPVDTTTDGLTFTTITTITTVIIQSGDVVDADGRLIPGAYVQGGIFYYADGTPIPPSVGASIYIGPDKPGEASVVTLIPVLVGDTYETTCNSGDVMDNAGNKIPGAYVQGGKFFFSDGTPIPFTLGPVLYIGPSKPCMSNTGYGTPAMPPPPPIVPPANSPPTASIRVAPSIMQAGDTARVSWTSTEVQSARVIFPDISYVAATGIEDWTTDLPGTYAFSIVANNDLGEAADTAQLTVLSSVVSPPVIILGASNNDPGLSAQVTITWTVTNAASVGVTVQDLDTNSVQLVSTNVAGSYVVTRTTAGFLLIEVEATNAGGSRSRTLLLEFAAGRRISYGTVQVPATDLAPPPAGHVSYGTITLPEVQFPQISRVSYGTINVPAVVGLTHVSYGTINVPAVLPAGRISYGTIELPPANPDVDRESYGIIHVPPVVNASEDRIAYGIIRVPPVIPDTVPDDLFPPSADPNADPEDYLVVALMNGQQVNLTPDLIDATWRYGGRFAKEIGYVADPASGALTLRNHDGKYNPIHPPAPIDTSPGVEVWIYRRDPLGGPALLLFSGWSRGVVATELAGFRETVIMPLEGALSRIATRNSELFARVDDNLYTGEIFNRFLDNTGWKGPRRVDRGNVQLNWRHVNAEGFAVGGSRQFQDTVTAFTLLAQAETGRVYDDYDRSIVFEDSLYRQNSLIQYTIRPRRGTSVGLERADYLDSTDSIINFIEPDEASAQLTAFQTWDIWKNFNPNSPVSDRTVSLLNGTSFTIRLLLDDRNQMGIVAIADIGPLVPGFNFVALDSMGQNLQWGADYVVDAYNLGQAVEIVVTNYTTDTIEFILHNIEVRLLQNPVVIGEQALDSIRNDNSIRKYGRKYVRYLAAKLFVDRGAVNQRLRTILERHKGVEGVDIKHRMDITGNVIRDPEYLHMRPGTAVALDDIFGTTLDKYHIDEVEHTLHANRQHKVTIRLTAD